MKGEFISLFSSHLMCRFSWCSCHLVAYLLHVETVGPQNCGSASPDILTPGVRLASPPRLGLCKPFMGRISYITPRLLPPHLQKMAWFWLISLWLTYWLNPQRWDPGVTCWEAQADPSTVSPDVWKNAEICEFWYILDFQTSRQFHCSMYFVWFYILLIGWLYDQHLFPEPETSIEEPFCWFLWQFANSDQIFWRVTTWEKSRTMIFLNPKYRWEYFYQTKSRKSPMLVNKNMWNLFIFCFFFRIKNASRNKNDDSLQENALSLPLSLAKNLRGFGICKLYSNLPRVFLLGIYIHLSYDFSVFSARNSTKEPSYAHVSFSLLLSKIQQRDPSLCKMQWWQMRRFSAGIFDRLRFMVSCHTCILRIYLWVKTAQKSLKIGRSYPPKKGNVHHFFQLHGFLNFIASDHLIFKGDLLVLGPGRLFDVAGHPIIGTRRGRNLENGQAMGGRGQGKVAPKARCKWGYGATIKCLYIKGAITPISRARNSIHRIETNSRQSHLFSAN